MRSTGDKFSFLGGSDEPGPACTRLLAVLKGIQQGKVDDKFGWLDVVQEHKESSYSVRGKGSDGVKMNGVVDNVDKLP